MALKYELETLDGLDDGVKSLYVEHDGKFMLGVEGLPKPSHQDDSGLRKKVDELLSEKKAADVARKKAEADARSAAEDAARKAGDLGSLEKSWQEKLTARETELQEENKRLNGNLTDVLVESVASRLASDIAISGSSNVLLPHIRQRLTIDYVDGKPVTRVLGMDGKPSAATLEELKTEFANNKAFAPIVTATKASGGGAAGAGNGGGATDKTMTRSQFDATSQADRQTFAKGGGKVID